MDNVEIAVKLENELGELFKSLIGSPQGDAASALFFIIYLATILRKSKLQIENKENHNISHLQDHNYAKSGSKQHLEEHNYSRKAPENATFTLDKQYADDISWASTSLSTLETIETIVPAELKARNLYVNESKTEKYSISRDSNDDWKNCKLVGSKLDTERDISNRKTLVNLAFQRLKPILLSQRTTKTAKLKIFEALLESIFLYNSELWGLTKQQEAQLEVFQRQILRRMLNLKYSEDGERWPSNKKLYQLANQTAWSEKIAKRRLSSFGHICRLPEDTPAKIALKKALKPVKRGKPKTTYLSTLEKQLKSRNIKGIKEGIKIAQDRDTWNTTIQGSST